MGFTDVLTKKLAKAVEELKNNTSVKFLGEFDSDTDAITYVIVNNIDSGIYRVKVGDNITLATIWNGEVLLQATIYGSNSLTYLKYDKEQHSILFNDLVFYTDIIYVANNNSGPTENRPTTAQVGTNYFDTSLAKPIWLKTAPSTWIDANGVIV